MLERKKTIKNGCLFAIVVPTVVLFLSFAFTIFIFKDDYFQAVSWKDWLFLLFGHIFALGISIFLLIVSLFFSAWLSWKDPEPIQTLRRFWPLIFALIYLLAPDLIPGWLDDTVIVALVGFYQYWKSRNDTEEAKFKEKDKI
ncbi:hypothetical protein LEP1GSC050_0821 [Leptospira broomii serovar Hurstbridge str. 5399]|uniref:Uncharacterized protein n=1 Tax=Leptospira broomii serovar Hurstbridge str. 5399 TaxID=1049789 RepID=T0FI49_9LEPT|nr:hypothetical protein [Leptospira broomii]EQA47282.1 hypothetical protein LEP1GSC050_0821 [Leptospira broomii serovar Hurstbridge str. 5399]